MSAPEEEAAPEPAAPRVEFWEIRRRGKPGRRGYGPSGDAAQQKLRRGETIHIVGSRAHYTRRATRVAIDEKMLLRERRNRLLDKWRWTVQPDSPLTAPSRAAWLAYLRSLHGLLLSDPDPASVIFPELPPLEYEPVPALPYPRSDA